MRHKTGVIAIMVAFLTAYFGVGARRALSPNPVPFPISLTFVPKDSIYFENFLSYLSNCSSWNLFCLGVSQPEEILFFLFSRYFY